jgi:hypothetical protein
LVTPPPPHTHSFLISIVFGLLFPNPLHTIYRAVHFVCFFFEKNDRYLAKAQFKQVVPIKEEAVLARIHQNYRIGYVCSASFSFSSLSLLLRLLLLRLLRLLRRRRLLLFLLCLSRSFCYFSCLKHMFPASLCPPFQVFERLRVAAAP